LCARALLSTRSPYPTLFRSGKSCPVLRIGFSQFGFIISQKIRMSTVKFYQNFIILLDFVCFYEKQKADEEHQGKCAYPQIYASGDRKSTRLNSSHVSISYAV